MQRNPMTPEGYESLMKDLKHHKQVLRPQVVQDIEEARAHGDLSENAEYDSAKERQSLIEGRIRWLEGQVASADVIDVKKLPESERVVFGTTVVVENIENGEQRTWRIVGEHEADVSEGTISWQSPVAKALIGKNVGQEATVPAPGGTTMWEILEVRYE